ncbi:GOLPH3/VPS74 family protein [Cellulomonas triticagri]|uniref:GPP34 family phosphoprotein n=1 Tax=Cellulomonas triticagri TaxID=2483352 RepID=A0A3M2JQ90_9CELL|nr:GPP34 family phosphoprotein [Cellulomonas triticagri]RMI13803.1 GPP34 family phosphoprotein [Cellulomonas triticagri]
MTVPPDAPVPDPPVPDPPVPDRPALVEDLLLLLLDPRSGTFAGEGMPLFHVLAGGVLVDLAVQERLVIADRSTWRGRLVEATGDAPGDPLLRPAWDRAARSPVDVQVLIAEIGPVLRAPTVDRLVVRGDLRTERRRFLGLFPTQALVDGGTGRRDTLLAPVRAALVDGAEPDDRTAALAALLSASGSLPALHRDIPWSGAVHDRGKALEAADWGAAEAAEAVRRTIATITAASVAVAASATTGR